MSIKIEGYEILEKAGGTTDTTIWTARQISLDRNVSIWVMKASAAADPNLVNHFSTITRAISRLKHNNFPPVIDISKTENGEPYIVFENADSTSITRIIKEHGVYSVADALKIAKEVAIALDAAWKQTGLVHRNLKPDNIRIYADGNVKIFNFNSATIVQPGSNPLAFDDGMIVGTPNYAAPEQIDCLPSIDYHVDMYGLGASLYQMLTGKAPFDEEPDPMKVLELQRSGHLPNPKVKNPSLSDEVVYLLARLMAKKPEDRYVWWLDVVEDIEHILVGRPLRMTPPNGVVRSTIDQKSLVASPIVVPANNTPISAEVYAQTVRNFKSSVQEPLQQQNASQGVATMPIQSTEKHVIKPEKPKQNNAQSAASYVKNTLDQDSKEKKIGKRKTISSTTKLIVSFACIFVFGLSIYVIINLLGPAVQQTSEQSQAPKNEVIIEDSSKETYVDTKVEETDFSNDATEVADFNAPEETVEYTTVDEVAKSESTVVEEANEEPPRNVMLRKAYNELSTKNIAEARVAIKKIFDEYSEQPGVNRAECRAVLALLNTAVPEEQAVGKALVKQTQIAFKTVTIEGKTLEIKAYAYANGELHCHARKTGTVQTHKISIPLSKASPQEMYNILKVEPDASKEMMVTKAILALRVNNHGDFVRFSRKVKALQCFADFLE